MCSCERILLRAFLDNDTVNLNDFEQLAVMLQLNRKRTELVFYSCPVDVFSAIILTNHCAHH